MNHELKTTVVTLLAVAVDISEDDHMFAETNADPLWPYARRIFVGTGGDVAVYRYGYETAFTYKNVPDGCYLDGAFTGVADTSTAGDMIAEQ